MKHHPSAVLLKLILISIQPLGFRVGAEYLIIGRRFVVPFRAGFFTILRRLKDRRINITDFLLDRASYINAGFLILLISTEPVTKSAVPCSRIFSRCARTYCIYVFGHSFLGANILDFTFYKIRFSFEE